MLDCRLRSRKSNAATRPAIKPALTLFSALLLAPLAALHAADTKDWKVEKALEIPEVIEYADFMAASTSSLANYRESAVKGFDAAGKTVTDKPAPRSQYEGQGTNTPGGLSKSPDA